LWYGMVVVWYGPPYGCGVVDLKKKIKK